MIIQEIKNFSKWFRWLLLAVFIIYISAWFFTIYLAKVQKDTNLNPVLPVVAKDSEEYKELAESLIADQSFASWGETNTLRTPGYPAFVAILKYTTGSYFVVTLVQILLVFFSAVLIRRLGILFHSAKVGEIAGAFFVLNPLVLTLALVILTDILFLFLLLLGFYLAHLSKENKIQIFSASLVFALAILVRPMGVFALPIFAVPFLTTLTSWKNKMKSLAVMVLIILVVLAPWVYRNYKSVGVADLTSFKAINLAFYAVPMFLANQNHTTAMLERANIEKQIGIPQKQWRDLKYAKPVSDFAQKIILEQPWAYLQYHISSSLPFLLSSSVQETLVIYKSAMQIKDKVKPGAIAYLTAGEWQLFFESITNVWWKLGERALWVLVYVIAIFGIWREKNKLKTWALVFVPVYLMLLSGPAANARYAMQGLPFMLILFAMGLIYFKEKFINRNLKSI